MRGHVTFGSALPTLFIVGAFVGACGSDSKSGAKGTSGGGDGGSAGNGGSSSTSGSGGNTSSSTGPGGSGTDSGNVGGSAGATGNAGAAGESGAGGDDGSGATSTSSTGTGGTSNAEPVCEGTAAECSSLTSDDECSAQLGCSVGGICDGEDTCAEHAYRSACEDAGCTWLTPCQPLIECDTFMASTACNLQQGCEWDGDEELCIVKLTDGCVDIDSQSACSTAVGCSWVEENFTCAGTATACAELDESECAAQAGCMAL